MAIPSRIVGTLGLVFAIYIFARVGFVYIIDPVPPASMWGFDAQGPAAVTNLRAGFGGFHLGTAILLLVALISGKLLAGLFVSVVMSSTVISSRLVGVVIDGPDPMTFSIMGREAFALGIFAVALLFVYFYPAPSQSK